MKSEKFAYLKQCGLMGRVNIIRSVDWARIFDKTCAPVGAAIFIVYFRSECQKDFWKQLFLQNNAIGFPTDSFTIFIILY